MAILARGCQPGAAPDVHDERLEDLIHRGMKFWAVSAASRVAAELKDGELFKKLANWTLNEGRPSSRPLVLVEREAKGLGADMFHGVRALRVAGNGLGAQLDQAALDQHRLQRSLVEDGVAQGLYRKLADHLRWDRCRRKDSQGLRGHQLPCPKVWRNFIQIGKGDALLI